MAKIEKLPSGSYRIRVYNKKTGKIKSITAESKAEVKRLAAEYEYNMDRINDGKFTVGEVIDQYISRRSSVASPSTIRGYRRMQRANYASIENMSMSMVNNSTLQEFVNELCKDYSPKTVRNVFGLLSSAIRALYPDISINVTLPQKNIYIRTKHSESNIQALLDNATGNLRKAILLSALGSMRQGEISALKYKDIDGNVIHVHADLVYDEHNKWVYKPVPKNSTSDRYIEYADEVIAELGFGDPDEYIVPILPNTIGKEFIKLRNQLGINYRFHDLRHYHAAFCHAIGIPDQYIMKRGGWKTDAVLKEVYRDTIDEAEMKFTDLINKNSRNFFDA